MSMSDHNSFYWRMYHTLKEIYVKPKYIALNALAAIFYYYLFGYLISIQQSGIFLVLLPTYLVYLLVITSSIALTIGIFSIRNTRNNEAKEVSTGIGAATAVVGGLIGGCGCEEPLILGLTAFGLSTSDAFALLNFISAYQIPLFSLMIVINLFVVIYYLNKLSQPSCELRKKRK